MTDHGESMAGAAHVSIINEKLRFSVYQKLNFHMVANLILYDSFKIIELFKRNYFCKSVKLEEIDSRQRSDENSSLRNDGI